MKSITTLILPGLLTLFFSFDLFADQLPEYKLWQITADTPTAIPFANRTGTLAATDYGHQVKGYIFGSIDQNIEEERLVREIPHFIKAIEEVNFFMFEKTLMREDTTPLDINCNEGLAQYLTVEEMEYTKKKLQAIYGFASLYTRYVHCLTPNALLDKTGIKPKVDSLIPYPGVDIIVAKYAIEKFIKHGDSPEMGLSYFKSIALSTAGESLCAMYGTKLLRG